MKQYKVATKQYKNSKKVKVHYETIKVERSYYVCPCCKTEVRGADIGKHILRFRCTYCNNPLEIDYEN